MRRGRGHLRIVLYHHLTDSPGPFCNGLGVATSPDRFLRHLDYFEKEYDFVDLEMVLQGTLPARPLLLTFDDAYRSVLDVAAPELRRRGLPSVFFLTAGALFGDGFLLDNLLCYLGHQRGLPAVAEAAGVPAGATLRELLVECIPALPPVARKQLAVRLVEAFDLDLQALRDEASIYLDLRDVAKLVDSKMEIGCHTETHTACRGLGREMLLHELHGSRRALEQASGRRVRAFSFPFGSRIDASPDVLALAREIGYEALFLVESRMNPPDHRGPAWFRVSTGNVPTKKLFRRLEILPRLRSWADFLRGRTYCPEPWSFSAP
jgi:peptidoglycan/xylan/chitin deacetylase (PgdA/CDA1 family)